MYSINGEAALPSSQVRVSRGGCWTQGSREALAEVTGAAIPRVFLRWLLGDAQSDCLVLITFTLTK